MDRRHDVMGKRRIRCAGFPLIRCNSSTLWKRALPRNARSTSPPDRLEPSSIGRNTSPAKRRGGPIRRIGPPHRTNRILSLGSSISSDGGMPDTVVGFPACSNFIGTEANGCSRWETASAPIGSAMRRAERTFKSARPHRSNWLWFDKISNGGAYRRVSSTLPPPPCRSRRVRSTSSASPG